MLTGKAHRFPAPATPVRNAPVISPARSPLEHNPQATCAPPPSPLTLKPACRTDANAIRSPSLFSRAKPRDLKRPPHNHSQPTGDPRLLSSYRGHPVPTVGRGRTGHTPSTNHSQPPGDPPTPSSYRGHPVPPPPSPRTPMRGGTHPFSSSPALYSSSPTPIGDPQNPTTQTFDMSRTYVLLSISSRAMQGVQASHSDRYAAGTNSSWHRGVFLSP